MLSTMFTYWGEPRTDASTLTTQLRPELWGLFPLPCAYSYLTPEADLLLGFTPSALPTDSQNHKLSPLASLIFFSPSVSQRSIVTQQDTTLSGLCLSYTSYPPLPSHQSQRPPCFFFFSSIFSWPSSWLPWWVSTWRGAARSCCGCWWWGWRACRAWAGSSAPYWRARPATSSSRRPSEEAEEKLPKSKFQRKVNR